MIHRYHSRVKVAQFPAADDQGAPIMLEIHAFDEYLTHDGTEWRSPLAPDAVCERNYAVYAVWEDGYEDLQPNGMRPTYPSYGEAYAYVEERLAIAADMKEGKA